MFDFYTYSKKGVPKCYLSSDDGQSWTGEISETCRVHKLMEFAMFSHDGNGSHIGVRDNKMAAMLACYPQTSLKRVELCSYVITSLCSKKKNHG